MRLTHKMINTPFNVIYDCGDNHETPKEFVKSSEGEFNLLPVDLEDLTEDQLNDYIHFLDELWMK